MEGSGALDVRLDEEEGDVVVRVYHGGAHDAHVLTERLAGCPGHRPWWRDLPLVQDFARGRIDSADDVLCRRSKDDLLSRCERVHERSCVMLQMLQQRQCGNCWVHYFLIGLEGDVPQVLESGEGIRPDVVVAAHVAGLCDVRITRGV
jgi:hypothetical protein